METKLICCFCLITFFVYSQDFVNGAASQSIEIMEPIDLNNELEQLLELGLIDPGCLDEMKLYVQRYGPFLHPYELQAITCLKEEDLNKLLPITVVTQSSGQYRNESELLLRYKYQFQSFKAQDSNLFLGLPAYRFSRFKKQWNNQRLRLSVESDPGEKGLSFISASMETKLRRGRLILGDYQLGLAQGVLIWNAFGGGSSRNVYSYHKNERTSPISGSNELHFLRGYYFSHEWSKIKVQQFSSFRNKEGYLLGGNTKQTGNGLYGTVAELENRYRLREFLTGAALSKKWDFSSLSAQAYYLHYLDRLNLQQEAALHYSFSFTKTYNNGRIYGELAKAEGLAAIVGSQLSLGKEVDLAINLFNSTEQFNPPFENAHRKSWIGESSLHSSLNFKANRRYQFSFFIAKASGKPWKNNFTKEDEAIEIGGVMHVKTGSKQQLYLAYREDWEISESELYRNGFLRFKYQVEWEDLAKHRIRIEGIQFSEKTSYMAYYQAQFKLGRSQRLQFRFSKIQMQDGSPLFYNYQLALWMAYSGGVYSESGHQMALKYVLKRKQLRFEFLFSELCYPERESWSSGDRSFKGKSRSTLSCQLIFSF